MRNKLTIILFGLLLAVGWTHAMAQGTVTTSPAQRLNLELVNYVSNYNIATQQNEYTNTLRLSQPTSDNKLTAGMLNNGDNIITVTRQGVKDGQNVGTPTDVATINLNRAPQTYPTNPISSIDFTSLITSSESLNSKLPANWSSTGLYGYSSWNGNTKYAYIQSGSTLSFTIPSDLNIHNGKINVLIYTTNTGYFEVGDWINTASAGWNRFGVSGVNAGDVITIQGMTQNYDGSFSAGQSPRMQAIQIQFIEPLVPNYDVTTTLNANGNVSQIGTTTTLSPNDEISLNGMNDLVDSFTAPTATNAHPDSYTYAATVDANISFPSASTGESSFYASADYQNGNGTVEGIVITGPNNWVHEYVGLEDEGAYCLWFNNDGNVLYTMPNDFTGNSVNVTITSDSGSYGAGSIMVNGESHTFTAGTSHTWTVPVRANGTILFACQPTDPYSVDVTKIVISSGNGSASNAPRHTVNAQSSSKVSNGNRQMLYNMAKAQRMISNNQQ